MSLLKTFRYAKFQVLVQQFDSMTESRILKHWREYEPHKVEALLSKGILRRTLIETAEAIFSLQISLERMEAWPPALARMEAWNRLMKHDEDKDEDADTPYDEILLTL